MQPKRLSVLGVGLLGGSLGLAAKSAITGCHVAGYAHRSATLQAALQSGVIDDGYDDPALAVQGADLIVLCTPVSLLGSMLDRIAGSLSPNAIVTDVGSTKASLVRLAEDRHPNIRFVGSHPMAGSEKRGVQFAQSDLFQNALCITTPTDRTDQSALEKVEQFWRLLGMRVARMSPEDHDRRICDVSHLPHAVAAALVAMQDPASLELAGKGFSDATRIAGGDGGLWRDIFLDNRDNLRGALTRLKQTLADFESLLKPDNAEALQAWLDVAAGKRNEIAQRQDK